MTTIRIAVVQAKTNIGDRAKNVQQAVVYVQQAAALGARIVCLPETYPGPWTPPIDYDAAPELAGAARDLDVYVIAGAIEEVPGEPDRHYDYLALYGPEGREVGRYRRTTPRGPWIYRGGTYWDFGYREAAELPVFRLPECTIGMLICSEVYVPELARTLSLRGAEIVFMPAGLQKLGQWDTWRTLTRARAIENLVFTATCQNVVGNERAPSTAGLAMICSPEGVLAESSTDGVLVAECDLSRLQWLRELEDGPDFPGEKACKTGVLWQWYRSELYGSPSL